MASIFGADTLLRTDLTLIPMIMTVSIPFVAHGLSPPLIFENLSVMGSLRNYKMTGNLEQKMS